MRRKVFIAVNLPEDIRKKLSDCRYKWLELPAKWTKKENLHITLAFLGYLSDEEMLDACGTAREIAGRHEFFSIALTKIIYGPRKGTPRMVWVEGEESEGLGLLQKDLERSLSKKGRGYAPHITLARLKQLEFRKIDPEEIPEVSEEISLNFEVNSIEVMESRLKRGGLEYIILESCPLKS